MRLIDADAFIADARVVGLDTAEKVLFALSHQPTIEPMKWIPCSERLTSEGEDVMAWVESGDEARIACCNYVKEVWFDAIMDVEVSPIAWMPLPPAWEGADNA